MLRAAFAAEVFLVVPTKTPIKRSPINAPNIPLNQLSDPRFNRFEVDALLLHLLIRPFDLVEPIPGLFHIESKQVKKLLV